MMTAEENLYIPLKETARGKPKESVKRHSDALLKYEIDIELEIVEWLITHNICDDSVKAKKVSLITINKDLTFDLIVSASQFKPFISKRITLQHTF